MSECLLLLVSSALFLTFIVLFYAFMAKTIPGFEDSFSSPIDKKDRERLALALRQKPAKKERIFEIDFLRGFDLFLMILAHFTFIGGAAGWFFTLKEGLSKPGYVQAMENFLYPIFKALEGTPGSPNLYFLEFIFSSLFMVLSGISCSFAKDNLQRAIKLAYVALGLSLLLEAANWLLPFPNGHEYHLYMGILNALSLALILYSVFDHFLSSWIADVIAGSVCLIGYLVTTYLANGPYPSNMVLANMPEDWWKVILGLAFAGDDCFSLFQTLTFVFFGGAIGKTLYKNKKSILPASFPKKWAIPFTWMGRHSLVIFLLHFPALYLLLLAIMAPGGYYFKL
jgi:uncharacterized membrane protein